jgi:hypothetical protein
MYHGIVRDVLQFSHAIRSFEEELEISEVGNADQSAT